MYELELLCATFDQRDLCPMELEKKGMFLSHLGCAGDELGYLVCRPEY